MKRTLRTLAVCVSASVISLVSLDSSGQERALPGDAEGAPFTAPEVTSPVANRINTLWSVLYNYNIQQTTNGAGYAGVMYLNNEFWVSKWAYDTLTILDNSGMLVRKVTIPSIFVTGSFIRAMTTDGNNVYASVNSTSIKKLTTNSVSPTLVSSITAPIAVRSLTYDATANAGAGGFWISNFNTGIYQISMTGTVLNSITAASHGLTGMYGSAIDNYSPGGPYLWVYDQNVAGATGVSKCSIYQISIATGLQTGVIHDCMTDVAAGFVQDSSLAGGLYLYAPQPGLLTLVGLLQGVPTNQLFGYDMNVFVGLNEPDPSGKFLSVNPSMASDMIDVRLDKQDNKDAYMQIFDANGRLVFERRTRAQNNYINVADYSSGLYFVKVNYGAESYTSRFVKNQ
jgi:hypothetical protein